MSEPALKLSEIFASVQGEGPSAGEASTFLRLATCNLHCTYCDTKYTWDWNNHRYRDEVTTVTVGDLARRVRAHAARRLVVTGGEPMLQQRGIAALLGELGDGWFVEIETNGTLEPSPELARRVAQWNVSPKLAASGNREGLRLRPAVLRRYLDTGRAWLKLVVATDADVAEAEALVTALDWPAARVLLMPEAQTRATLAARTPFVSAAAEARGYRFSPRLHLERWGQRRGV